MTDPAGPPPSYDDVQGQPPSAQGPYPQPAPYPDPNKLAGYSTNVPYPPQSGQPPMNPTPPGSQPYPAQAVILVGGYPQAQYPYGQPPLPAGMTYPVAGQYVHPTAVAYNQQGQVVVTQGGPMTTGGYGRGMEANSGRRLVLSICIGIMVFVFFIILMNILF